jgi:hypothetical protein
MTIRPQKSCIYCGGDAETRDHIPPKSFFPTPRPSDLITVPSCGACNSGFQMDDDYAQKVLLAREDVSNHPVAQRLIPKLLRSWERPRGKALPISIARTARELPIYTSDGVVAGKTPAYGVSSTRMHRFVERTVRGLFFNEVGCVLPAAYDVGVVLFLERRASVLAEIGQSLAGKSIRRIGEGAFAYCWTSAPDDANATIWLFTFYDRIAFAGLTFDPFKPAPHAV